MINKISKILLFIFFYSTIYSQSNPSCCQASSIKAFTDLANDLSFVISHEEPITFVLENPTGKDITFPVEGDKDGKAYYISANKNSNKWIFVFQEWWGLNDYIRLKSEKLHESFPDVHILAIDLYDGKVATTREEATTYMQGAKPERIEKLITSASSFSGSETRIGSIGWCFGGAWSNKTAVLLGKKSTACVMYYGMPIKDPEQIQNIHAPVLGIFADQDGWITPKVVAEFKSEMIKNNKSVETYGYDAQHAFANPSNPKYDKTLSDEAWTKTIGFFTKNL